MFNFVEEVQNRSIEISLEGRNVKNLPQAACVRSALEMPSGILL